MTKKLTKRAIDSFTFNPDVPGKDIRWDADISGLGVRLYPSGKKSFVLSYRQNGTKRLYTIGQYGQITLEQARDLAKKRLGEVADGKDPVITRRDSRKKNEWTVQKAHSEFMERYAKVYNKHWKETERIFQKDILPAIGTTPVEDITKDDILRLVDAVLKRKAGIMANRTLKTCQKFFNWCIERDLIEHSPADRITMPAKAVSRDRVLSDDELSEVWKASEIMGYPFGYAVQLLTLTAQRRSEVLSAKWEDIDPQKQVWTIPRENTKTDRQHLVPLPVAASEVISKCKKLGPYIFTSAGPRPFENMSRDKIILDKLISKSRLESGLPPITPWRIHDLRRTAASGMARLGVAPHVIEKVLNHSSGIISGVAAVYNRHHYTTEIGEALQLWANHVRKITSRHD
jgi:integrase